MCRSRLIFCRAFVSVQVKLLAKQAKKDAALRKASLAATHVHTNSKAKWKRRAEAAEGKLKKLDKEERKATSPTTPELEAELQRHYGRRKSRSRKARLFTRTEDIEQPEEPTTPELEAELVVKYKASKQLAGPPIFTLTASIKTKKGRPSRSRSPEERRRHRTPRAHSHDRRDVHSEPSRRRRRKRSRSPSPEYSPIRRSPRRPKLRHRRGCPCNDCRYEK